MTQINKINEVLKKINIINFNNNSSSIENNYRLYNEISYVFDLLNSTDYKHADDKLNNNIEILNKNKNKIKNNFNYLFNDVKLLRKVILNKRKYKILQFNNFIYINNNSFLTKKEKQKSTMHLNHLYKYNVKYKEILSNNDYFIINNINVNKNDYEQVDFLFNIDIDTFFKDTEQGLYNLNYFLTSIKNTFNFIKEKMKYNNDKTLKNDLLNEKITLKQLKNLKGLKTFEKNNLFKEDAINILYEIFKTDDYNYLKNAIFNIK